MLSSGGPILARRWKKQNQEKICLPGKQAELEATI
jgi:hypothetical protein